MDFLSGANEIMMDYSNSLSKVTNLQQDNNFKLIDNVLTILSENVTIDTELAWEDKLRQFFIKRSEELEKAGVIPVVIIQNNRRGQQPVIGPKTNDGLSFGRYELARGSFDELVIDGCDVTLETTAVENFTIGVYGLEKVPTITLLNNARLTCPETLGTRVMQIGPEALMGSTKHSRPSKYIVIKPGEKPSDYIREEVKVIMKDISAITDKFDDVVSCKTSERFAMEALTLLNFNNDLDVTFLLNGEYEYQRLCNVAACCFLSLPDECITDDIHYEIKRWPILAERFGIDVSKNDSFGSISHSIIKKIFNSQKFSSLTPCEVRFVYELIPLYEFSFSGKSDEECAEEWFYATFEK